MLQGQIYAVVFKDAVVFAQIAIADADGVIVTSDDGEFHFRVSHQVTALLSVMGDADDFSVARKLSAVAHGGISLFFRAFSTLLHTFSIIFLPSALDALQVAPYSQV